MGASTWTIISKVLLVEARSSLILSTTTLMISLLSYSAAAGMIGGGGLGLFSVCLSFILMLHNNIRQRAVLETTDRYMVFENGVSG